LWGENCATSESKQTIKGRDLEKVAGGPEMGTYKTKQKGGLTAHGTCKPRHSESCATYFAQLGDERGRRKKEEGLRMR